MKLLQVLWSIEDEPGARPKFRAVFSVDLLARLHETNVDDQMLLTEVTNRLSTPSTDFGVHLIDSLPNLGRKLREVEYLLIEGPPVCLSLDTPEH